MSWETLFGIANLWPLPFWLLLAFGPRSDIMARIVLYGGVATLALAYAVLLPLIMTGLLDPISPSKAPMDFTQLSGVMALFASKGGATIGWIHYLAFDLFVGLWVARNADAHGIARWIQVPLLFFVLMAGPFGLTLYLLLRFARKNPSGNMAIPS
ncbi:MAG: ABA4-like family protein [Sphingorhabdus sp.]